MGRSRFEGYFIVFLYYSAFMEGVILSATGPTIVPLHQFFNFKVLKALFGAE